MSIRRRTERPRALTGEVRAPGDKSISHRALILAALARGPSDIADLNVGEDVVATVRVLTQLGAAITLDTPNRRAHVEGSGWDGLREADDVLDAGNSGTSMRLLAAICSGIHGLSVLTGDESLRARPMLRVVSPLRQMGAGIDGRAYGDRAPLAIRGSDLHGIEVATPVASAQVKSAILLAGLRASGRTTVTEPRPSRDHTERMLNAAGLPIERSGTSASVAGGVEPAVRDWHVPGDLSAAMYLLVAALIVPGSDLTVVDVGVNPTRSGALDVLKSMGADLEIEPTAEVDGEPRGNVRARTSSLTGVTVDPAAVPTLIDEIPVLAVAATQAEGRTVIGEAGELRVKESDRIGSLCDQLRRMGAEVEELHDGLVIDGPTALGGGDVDSMGDHRIAMALAVAGLIAEDNARVRGWRSVETSFPEFLDVLGEAQKR